MAAPAIIHELVARFAEHRETYHSGQYNEAQLRQEFLNPFFEALGWDVYNKKGYADAYKEVIHEAAIKIGGRTRAPDYCFRVGGGRPSFIVEAKKSAVDISAAASPLLCISLPVKHDGVQQGKYEFRSSSRSGPDGRRSRLPRGGLRREESPGSAGQGGR